MRLALFLAVLSLSSSANAQTGEFVLVRRDAYLYAAPDRAAERARDPLAREYASRLGPGWPFRFVREHGEFVEVAPLGSNASDHCYPSANGLLGLDVRLFVERRALVPVVRALVTRSFDDGSGFTLASGVALVSRGRDRYDAEIGGATMRVELRADEVDWRYGLSDAPGALDSIAGLLAPGDRLDFSGGTFVAEAADRRAAASRVIDFSAEETTASARSEPARSAFAVAIEGQGSRVRATVQGRCAEVVGFMRSTDVTTERPPRPVSDLGSRRGTPLRAGAVVYWPNGERAGTAAPDAVLDGRGRSNGERTCFDQPLRRSSGANDDGSLTLCVDAGSILRQPR
jgi:hypothetical protein